MQENSRSRFYCLVAAVCAIASGATLQCSLPAAELDVEGQKATKADVRAFEGLFKKIERLTQLRNAADDSLSKLAEQALESRKERTIQKLPKDRTEAERIAARKASLDALKERNDKGAELVAYNLILAEQFDELGRLLMNNSQMDAASLCFSKATAIEARVFTLFQQNEGIAESLLEADTKSFNLEKEVDLDRLLDLLNAGQDVDFAKSAIVKHGYKIHISDRGRFQAREEQAVDAVDGMRWRGRQLEQSLETMRQLAMAVLYESVGLKNEAGNALDDASASIERASVLLPEREQTESRKEKKRVADLEDELLDYLKSEFLDSKETSQPANGPGGFVETAEFTSWTHAAAVSISTLDTIKAVANREIWTQRAAEAVINLELGSLEFRVSELCNFIASENLNAEQQKEACAAIKAVLAEEFADSLVPGQIKKVKHLLVDAINTRYQARSDDKLARLLADVRRSEELTHSNPLQTYKSLPIDSESIAGAIATYWRGRVLDASAINLITDKNAGAPETREKSDEMFGKAAQAFYKVENFTAANAEAKKAEDMKDDLELFQADAARRRKMHEDPHILVSQAESLMHENDIIGALRTARNAIERFGAIEAWLSYVEICVRPSLNENEKLLDSVRAEVIAASSPRTKVNLPDWTSNYLIGLIELAQCRKRHQSLEWLLSAQPEQVQDGRRAYRHEMESVEALMAKALQQADTRLSEIDRDGGGKDEAPVLRVKDEQAMLRIVVPRIQAYLAFSGAAKAAIANDPASDSIVGRTRRFALAKLAAETLRARIAAGGRDKTFLWADRPAFAAAEEAIAFENVFRHEEAVALNPDKEARPAWAQSILEIVPGSSDLVLGLLVDEHSHAGVGGRDGLYFALDRLNQRSKKRRSFDELQYERNLREKLLLVSSAQLASRMSNEGRGSSFLNSASYYNDDDNDQHHVESVPGVKASDLMQPFRDHDLPELVPAAGMVLEILDHPTLRSPLRTSEEQKDCTAWADRSLKYAAQCADAPKDYVLNDPKTFDDAFFNQCRNPMGLVFLSMALYTKTISIPDSECEDRRMWSEATRRIQSLVGQIIDTGFFDDYPLLVQAWSSIDDRVSANILSNRIAQMLVAGQRQEAKDELWLGVRFHLGSIQLLKQLIEFEISCTTEITNDSRLTEELAQALQILEKSVPMISWTKELVAAKALFALDNPGSAEYRISEAEKNVPEEDSVALAEVKSFSGRLSLARHDRRSKVLSRR